MGGTGKIVTELKKLMIENGINIKINTEVTELVIKNKVSRIVTNNGDITNFDLLVCNADPPMVYSKLLKKYNLIKRPLKKKINYSILWDCLSFFLELKQNMIK